MKVKEIDAANGNRVVIVHPLDNPLNRAAWEAVNLLQYWEQHENTLPLLLSNTFRKKVTETTDALREALAAQGVTQESIDAFEETTHV